MLRVAGQDGVGARGRGDQLVAGIEPVGGVEPGLVVAREPRLDRFGQLTGDENDGLAAHEPVLPRSVGQAAASYAAPSDRQSAVRMSQSSGK